MSLFKKKTQDIAMKRKPDIAIMKTEGAIRGLMEALKYPDADIRAGAAKALGELKEKRALEPLCELLKDKDPYIRENAVVAIGAIIRDKIGHALEQKIVELTDHNTRELARIEATDYVKITEHNTRELAKLSIRKNLELGWRAIELLCTKDEDEYVREKAKIVLSEIESLLR